MNIVMVITQLLLLISVILIEKNKEKLNILKTITYVLILLLIYNIFICYFLNTVGVKITILSLSIINFSITILNGYKIFKDRKIQKYFIRISDIIFTFIVLIIAIIIVYFRFGLTFSKLSYMTSDPSVHYTAAYEFSKSTSLLDKAEINRYLDFKTMMPASYVNIGLLFKIFTPSYQIFEIFDVVVLILACLSFYYIISDKQEKKLNILIQIIISLVYVLGYPLNSMLYGFAYLSLALVFINTLLFFVSNLYKDKFNRTLILSICFLLNFSVFFSYYFFAPIIYIAEAFYILFEILKEKRKIFTFQNIFEVFYILILPGFIGLSYFILPGIVSKTGTDIQALTQEGSIYKNLFIDFILFIPFVIYGIIYKIIKNKENNIVVHMIILTILYSIVFFTLGMLNKVSSYYFYKINYIFWAFALIVTYITLEEFMKNDVIKQFAIICFIVYIILMGYGVLRVGNFIQKRSFWFNPYNKESDLSNIFLENSTEIIKPSITLSKADFELLNNLNEDMIKENSLIRASIYQRLWIYAIYNLETEEFWDAFFMEKSLDIEKWKASNKKYLIYIGENENLLKNNDIYKILYTAPNGFIIEK